MRHLVTYIDREWAGDRSTRQSSSCAVLQVDGCVLYAVCRGQHVRAQSSAASFFFLKKKKSCCDWNERSVACARASRVDW